MILHQKDTEVKEKISYKKANIKDISRLVEIEQSSFNYDQLDARKFRYFIRQAHADLIIQLKDITITGYGLLLYRKGTSLSRLYSFTIAKEFQGQNLSGQLLLELEKFARKEDSSYIRLEVKKTNIKAISLYEKLEYIQFSIKHQYYENNEDAVCMEKNIQKLDKKQNTFTVPFYEQTTEFTCGPSSLMMAMSSLDPKYKTNRTEEIQIWREATTVFMTSGHGGCGPHGLALSAYERGFLPQLYLNTKELLFIDSVRQKHKKEVIKIVQDEFNRQIKIKKIPIHYGKIKWNILRKIISAGGRPLVLISVYRLTETKSPHWVTITGMNDDFIFFNDPFVETDSDRIANISIPIRKDEFEGIAKFGSKKIQALLALYK